MSRRHQAGRRGYGAGGPERRTKAVDPVVQALALTDVVVEAVVTALLLSFAIQAHKEFGILDPHELKG